LTTTIELTQRSDRQVTESHKSFTFLNKLCSRKSTPRISLLILLV